MDALLIVVGVIAYAFCGLGMLVGLRIMTAEKDEQLAVLNSGHVILAVLWPFTLLGLLIARLVTP